MYVGVVDGLPYEHAIIHSDIETLNPFGCQHLSDLADHAP
jgi:hypothetical protein